MNYYDHTRGLLTNLGPIRAACNIEALDEHPDSHSNLKKAIAINTALNLKSVPTCKNSALYIDKNNKPILAVFGDTEEKENAHGIPIGSHELF